MPDYAKEILKAKQAAVDELNRHSAGMASAAYAILLNAIELNFNIENGKIQGGKDFIKRLNKLTVQVLDLIQTEQKFIGPISQFVKRMPVISDEISTFQKRVNGILVPPFETAKKIIIDEIIDKMLNNGLNQNFVVPLRDLIYQNVTSGSTLSEARTAIREFISGNDKDVVGKLPKYINQTAHQAVTAYSGAIGVKLMETFKYNAMRMVGSLRETSSPQCIHVVKDLNRIIKVEDWPEVKKIAEKNGLVDNTEFKDLPMNLLHWGCYHDFYPLIIKKSA